MNATSTITCANHPEVPVASFCRTCGKPLCAACRRLVGEIVFCSEHAPERTYPRVNFSSTGATPVNDSPYTAPAPKASDGAAAPSLAFLLGFIPGVGAIYNGQYAKGLVHAVIFGLLVTAISSGTARGFEPLLGIMIGVFVFYMAIEAYHTARKRVNGEPVEEFSSLMAPADGAFPMGAMVLIGLGILLLLNTLDLISLQGALRFWPAGLILLGLYMLYSRMRGGVR